MDITIKVHVSDQHHTGLRFPNCGRVLPCVLHLLPLEVHHDRDNTQVEFHVSNLIKLIDRVRMLDNDLIRLQTKVKTVREKKK